MSRVVLVTGGGRGIGRAIAIDMASRGWSVALGYRGNEAAANETIAVMQAADAHCVALRADVGRPDEAERLVRSVEDTLGGIEVLVHCVGPFHRTALLEETPEGWLEMFEGNLHSLFYCARAVAPGMMRRKWGRILAFSVANADRISAQPNVTAYSIAKTGVLALVRTWAQLLAPHGITVNAISPGFVDSGAPLSPDLSATVENIPARRLGALPDAVSAARFLLSDEASYVNGANLHLSGAWGL